MRKSALALAALLTGTVAVLAPSSASAATSANLIVNGDGESATCSSSGYDGMTVPGWQITGGSPNVVCFANNNGFPDASTSGAQPGNGYFTGGPFDSSSLTQTVDVSSAASAIDADTVTYNLSGWLGGYSSQNDRVGLTATFLNGSGGSLGTGAIGPVTAWDRGYSTKFLQRSTSAKVPAGTRSIKLVLAFTLTSGETADGYADNLNLTLSTSVTTPTLRVPPSTVPGFDHVFFVYFENRDYSEIIGNSQAPYLNSLASANSLLTNYHAQTHVSDPNYIAIWGGSVFGRRTNPYDGGINAPHLGTRADSAGKTWKGYADGASGDCDLGSHGQYAWNDLGITYFTDIQPSEGQSTQRCKDHIKPMTSMFSDLQSTATTPNLVWFAPDDCTMMEACSIKTGDDWAKATLAKIFASPAWTQQRTLVVVTFDEDGNGFGYPGGFGSGQTNRITTIVAGSQGTVKTGYQGSGRYDHYSSTRVFEQALGLGTLTSNDKYATPYNEVFTGK